MLRRRAGDDRERAALADELTAVRCVVLQPEAGMRADCLVELLRSREVRDPDPEVVDDAALSQRPVVNGLGAVAVGVEEKRAVVVVPVLGPRARRAVVAISRLRPGAPESVDLRPGRRDEGDVEAPRHGILFVCLGEREVGPLGESSGRCGFSRPRARRARSRRSAPMRRDRRRGSLRGRTPARPR